MKDETLTWISYADENLDVSTLALEHGHLNACLQNAQQAVEKYLKALIVENGLRFVRTHSVQELVGILAAKKSLRLSLKMRSISWMPYMSPQNILFTPHCPRPGRTRQSVMRPWILPAGCGILSMV